MQIIKRLIRKVRDTSPITKVITLLFVFDVLLVVTHWLWRKNFGLFNLDAEDNIPSIYQGIKLIAASGTVATIIILGYIKTIRLKKPKVAWVLTPFMIMFAFLALDEVGQLHEKAHAILSYWLPNRTAAFEQFFVSRGYESNFWLILMLPFILIAVFYLIYLLRYLSKQKVARLALPIVASIIYVTVLGIELASTGKAAFIGNEIKYNLAVSAEEFGEMFATTLFILFNLKWIRDLSIDI